MSADTLIDQLIAAPSATGRRALLRRHPEIVGEATVEKLKKQVEVRLRSSAADARRAVAATAAVAAEVDSPRARANVLLARAYLDHGTGRYARARDRYLEAETTLRSARETAAADRVLLPLFDALARDGDDVGARRTASRARRAFVRRGEDRWVVMVDMNLGNVHHRAGRLRTALRVYDRAADGLSRLGARAGAAVNDLNRANVLALIGRHDEAGALYGSTAAYFHAKDQRAAAAQADYNAATLRFMQGDFSAALAALSDVETAFEAEGDRRHLALIRLDRAEIMLRLGQSEAAAEEATRARDGFRKLGHDAETALAAGLAALARAERGSERGAGLSRAVTDLKRAGWRAWAASLSLHEAGFALRRGDPDRAAEIVRRALPTLSRASLPDRVAIARLLRARADEMRGRTARATRGYRDALEELGSLPLAWIAWRAHHGLARLARAGGDRREAERRFGLAERELEAVRDALAGDEVRGGLLEDSAPLYEDHVLFLLEGTGPRRAERAFDLLERARARTLLSGLEGLPETRHVEDHPRAKSIRAELQRLQRRVAAAIHGDAASEDRRTRPPRIRRAELARAERRARALRIRLESLLGPGQMPDRPLMPGPDAIRRRLRHGETLLAYAGLEGHLVAFVLDREGLRGPMNLTDLPRLERTIGDLRHDLTRLAAASGLRRAARRSTERRLADLHGMLIAPLESELTGDSLIVVPWGGLHGVPFHALLGPGGPLVADRTVIRTPSAGALWLVRGRPRRRSGKALVLGVPDLRAPRVGEECEALARRMPSARVACGDNATAERLRRSAATARILHVATHGLFRPESPRLSAFLLADGWFGLGDVYDLRLRTDLVVLASCDGGLGGVLRGGDSLGLARAFLLAGSRALLSALGPVRDDAAAFFVDAFYSALARGETIAGAHRDAVLVARDTFDHPALWGLFVLDGDGSARIPGVMP